MHLNPSVLSLPYTLCTLFSCLADLSPASKYQNISTLYFFLFLDTKSTNFMTSDIAAGTVGCMWMPHTEANSKQNSENRGQALYIHNISIFFTVICSHPGIHMFKKYHKALESIVLWTICKFAMQILKIYVDWLTWWNW